MKINTKDQALRDFTKAIERHLQPIIDREIEILIETGVITREEYEIKLKSIMENQNEKS